MQRDGALKNEDGSYRREREQIRGKEGKGKSFASDYCETWGGTN